MTFDELIRRIEAERAPLVRRKAVALAGVKRIHEAMKAGRRNPTPEEEVEAAALMADHDRAKAQLVPLDASLAEARQTKTEEDEMDRLMSDVRSTGVSGAPSADQVSQIGRPTRHGPAAFGPRWVRTSDRRPAVVERGTRFYDHEIVQDRAAAYAASDQAVIGQHGSLGQMVRAMTTTSGAAIIPTVWLGDIIDRARNLSAVLRAGAELIPMDALTVQIGRLTTDPVAGFRAEGSTIIPSDPVFDNVTLTAKTMSTLVVGSLEWFQDSDNVEEIVSNAIAAAFATQLDLMALMGGVIAGGEVGATGYNTTFPTPPNPRGILATLLAVAASSVLGGAANGTTQTATAFWREVQQTIFQILSFNESPNAFLWSAKLAQQYTDAYDTTNQPLNMPANIAALQRFVTNQIENFTQGTMSNVASDLFVGDFTQLLIGQRLDVTIQTLTERYAENGQVGIVAHYRGDVAPARPRAFAVYRYLAGAV